MTTYIKILKFTSIFYKIRTKLNIDVLRLLYFAFVYPHIHYGIEIYGNTYHCHLNKLEKLNNKILRISQKKSLSAHIVDLYKSFDTLPVSLLHDYHILLFLHKYIYNRNALPDIFATYFTPNTSVHHYGTRKNTDLHLTTVRTEFGKRALTFKGSMLWNSLPDNIKMIRSTSHFKMALRNYLFSPPQ